MLNILKTLVKDEEGQGLVEYGLIIALIALGAVLAMGLLGGQISAVFTDITTRLTNAIP